MRAVADASCASAGPRSVRLVRVEGRVVGEREDLARSPGRGRPRPRRRAFAAATPAASSRSVTSWIVGVEGELDAAALVGALRLHAAREELAPVRVAVDLERTRLRRGCRRRGGARGPRAPASRRRRSRARGPRAARADRSAAALHVAAHAARARAPRTASASRGDAWRFSQTNGAAVPIFFCEPRRSGRRAARELRRARAPVAASWRGRTKTDGTFDREREQLAVAVDDRRRDAGSSATLWRCCRAASARERRARAAPPGRRRAQRAARTAARRAPRPRATRARRPRGAFMELDRPGPCRGSTHAEPLAPPRRGARRVAQRRELDLAARAARARGDGAACARRRELVADVDHLEPQPDVRHAEERPARAPSASDAAHEPAAHDPHERRGSVARRTSGRRTDSERAHGARSLTRRSSVPPAFDDAQARAARARVRRRSPPPSAAPAARQDRAPGAASRRRSCTTRGRTDGSRRPSAETPPSRGGLRASGRRGPRAGRPAGAASSRRRESASSAPSSSFTAMRSAWKVRVAGWRPGLPRPTARATTSASAVRRSRADGRGRSRARRRAPAAPRRTRAMASRQRPPRPTRSRSRRRSRAASGPIRMSSGPSARKLKPRARVVELERAHAEVEQDRVGAVPAELARARASSVGVARAAQRDAVAGRREPRAGARERVGVASSAERASCRAPRRAAPPHALRAPRSHRRDGHPAGGAAPPPPAPTITGTLGGAHRPDVRLVVVIGGSSPRLAAALAAFTPRLLALRRVGGRHQLSSGHPTEAAEVRREDLCSSWPGPPATPVCPRCGTCRHRP